MRIERPRHGPEIVRKSPRAATARAAAVDMCAPARADIAALRIDPAFKKFSQSPVVSQMKFSPDGTQLALLSNESGSAQIELVDVATGRKRQLTDERGIDSMRWSGSDRLLFTRDCDGNERKQIYVVSTAEGARAQRLTHDDNAIHRIGGSRGDTLLYASNEGHAERFDLYLHDMKTGDRRVIFEGDGSLSPCGFVDKGKSVLISRGYGELATVNIESGAVKSLTAKLGHAHYGSASLKGERLQVLTNRGRDFIGLASINLRDNSLKWLTDVKWDAESIDHSRDGRYRVGRYNEDGYSRYRVFDTETHKVRKVDNMPEGVVLSQTFAPDGKSLMFVMSQPHHPSTMWKLDLATAKVAPFRLSDKKVKAPSLDPATLSRPALVHYSSGDGTKVPAFLYKPAGEIARYPAVVYVHGGPSSQYRPRYDPVVQYLVSRGYAVLAPNIRGSDGYGKEYNHADDGDKRPVAIEDVASAARYLRAQGVDERRIAVMGGSYGGYMTMAQLTMHPELWAAGVEIVGMSNLATFLENTGPWRRPNREAEYGSLQQPDLLEKLSPMTHVGRMKAPIMAIQGANDPRVPATEASQFVAAVRKQGGEAQFLLFDDEGHGIKKADNRAKTYTAVGDFLDAHLKGRDTKA